MSYKYVIQVRRNNALMRKVSGAMGQIFEHLNMDENSLHILEDLSLIEAPKPLTKKQRNEICDHLMAKAREENVTEILGFECVPYEESIAARTRKEAKCRLKT